jgi:hypothetical protein
VIELGLEMRQLKLQMSAFHLFTKSIPLANGRHPEKRKGHTQVSSTHSGRKIKDIYFIHLAFKMFTLSQAGWCISVIPATQEAEAGRSRVQDQAKLERP